MCGLKLRRLPTFRYRLQVTPHVGVWIETLGYAFYDENKNVTPHVGVWIETLTPRKRTTLSGSHLM